MTDLFQCTCPHCGQPMPDTKQQSGFDEWWGQYPKRGDRKVGKAKAEEYYRKALKSATPEILLAAVKSYAAGCKASDTYPVDAFRWLRDRRWLDEVLRPEEKTDDVLSWWAGQLNSGKRLYSLPSGDILKQLSERGLVSAERLREVTS